MFRSLAILSAFTLTACGPGAPAAKPAASKVSATAKSNTSALKSQKPATPMKASTPPKAVPAAKTAGSTSVKPPAFEGSELETWEFTGVDLDGDGTGENGVIAADEKNLLAWFSGTVATDTGTEKYDAVVWVVPEGVGFLFDYGSSGALACGETATGSSGCIACQGTECSEIGLDASATK